LRPSRTRILPAVGEIESRLHAIAEAKRCLACGICCDCHLCATACQANAIDYAQIAETQQLQVGAIVLAPGYEIEVGSEVSLDTYGGRQIGRGQNSKRA
jgi:heterodisulfide reductase subunit A-like polyferredoxin